MQKKHALFIIALWVLVATLPTLLAVAVDPIQVLRPHNTFYRPVNVRYGIPPLIHQRLVYHKDKKHVVLGSSVLRDFLPADARALAGMDQTLQLIVEGMSSDEMIATIQALADTGQVESLVLSFDPFRYFEPDGYRPEVFPYELYSHSWWQRVQGSTKLECLKHAAGIVLGLVPPMDYDQFNAAMPTLCRQKVFSTYAQQLDRVLAVYETRKATFRKEFIDLSDYEELHIGVEAIRQLPPSIILHILIPPSFSAGEYNVPAYQQYFSGMHYLVRKFEGHSNIFLYAFDDVPEIVNNINNFMNGNHFGVGIDRYMMRAIHEKKHLISRTNIDTYLDGVWLTRTQLPVYSDPAHTVTFEGAMDEALFMAEPSPYGPAPLSLPD